MQKEMGDPDKNATKQEVLDLMKEKDKIEEELEAWIGVLESQNVGMDDPLIDQEGFPRNDVDVAKIREARNKIICLKNDHKAIMIKIEKGLHSLHAQSREGVGANSKMDVENSDSKLPPAFAFVDSVAKGSPADTAGLVPGDKIVAFGSINHENFQGNLKVIGEVVEHSVNTAIRVQIIRSGGKIMTLSLKPQKWSGRGLLGCHIKPLEETIDR